MFQIVQSFVETLLKISDPNIDGFGSVLWVSTVSIIVQNRGNHLKNYFYINLRNWSNVTNLEYKINRIIFGWVVPFSRSGHETSDKL